MSSVHHHHPGAQIWLPVRGKTVVTCQVLLHAPFLPCAQNGQPSGGGKGGRGLRRCILLSSLAFGPLSPFVPLVACLDSTLPPCRVAVLLALIVLYFLQAVTWMERGRGGVRRWQQNNQQHSAPSNHGQQHEQQHHPQQQQQYWFAPGPCYYPYPPGPAYYPEAMMAQGYQAFSSWPQAGQQQQQASQPYVPVPQQQLTGGSQAVYYGDQAMYYPAYYGDHPHSQQSASSGYMAWPVAQPLHGYGFVPMAVMVPYSAPQNLYAELPGSSSLPSPSGQACQGGDSDPEDSYSEAGSVSGEDCTPNFTILEDAEASSWSSLTVGILQSVIVRLSEGDVKGVRQVCRHWRAVLDQNLEQLTPSSMKSKTIVARFPNLRVLHLTQCENIRNRDLLIIARSGLRLHTLTLGDDTNRPWVSNKGLASVSQVTTITSLNLQDCNGVTNLGLKALNNLKSLTHLSLKGCCKLTNSGLEALAQNTALTTLNLFGCLRISDKGLLPLGQLHLHSLSLGKTRVKDEGLGYLGQITSLRELYFMSEEMTSQGVKQLSTLTNLHSLALRDCAHVSGDALSQLIPELSRLEMLDLYKSKDFNDASLGMCLDSLSNVGAVCILAIHCLLLPLTLAPCLPPSFWIHRPLPCSYCPPLTHACPSPCLTLMYCPSP